MTHKRSICFIPSGEMLRLHPVSHWLRRYEEFTQRVPGEIVLPAVGFSGPLFNSAVHPTPIVFSRSNLLPDWIRSARDEMGEKGVLWGSILMELGFLDNEALWLMDQFGDSLTQACLVNPVVQSIVGDLILELAETGVDGIVLDVTDAYPNSTSAGRVGYLLHCYCDACTDALRLKGFKESKEIFSREPLLGRLMLRSDDDGVAHIDPPQEWLDSRDSNALIALAVARKFVSEDAEGLQSAAARLLAYLRARVEVTAEAIRSILSAARSANKRTALVLGDYKADLSQLVTLPALDSAKSADEYWLPFVPERGKLPGEWRAAQFLAGRSTYYFNAFFEVVEKAPRRLVLGGPEEFLRELLQASKSLMNNKLGPGAAYTAEKLAQFEGFVGVPLSQDDHIEIVEQLASAATGDVLPPALLDRFRIETSNQAAVSQAG